MVLLSSLKKIEIRPIGFVRRTSFNEDVRDKSLVSKIVLRKDLSKALDGIEDFSRLFVIFWMHKLNTENIALQVHPSGRAELPLVGILATRGPLHPNPIGLTVAELEKREENVLWVRGLDAFDGTPVLDIKPYGCPWDVVVNFRAPKWFTKLSRRFVSVVIDERMWKRYSAKLLDSEALKVLREMIDYMTEKLGPRIDETDVWSEGVAFFSKGKEFLTVEVTKTKGLRIHFYPSAGVLFNRQEKFSVERVNLWKSSYHKASGKYRAMTAWVSKEVHLPAIKKLIDRIPTSQ